MLLLEITTSLDGFVAGPNPSAEEPLGQGGELLHEWVIATEAWREAHGMEGGEGGVDDQIVRERIARAGATIMGRRMFSGGEGGWAGDPRANGWWGDEPPFHHPVFVLTHHPREPLELRGTTFTFVGDGIDSALEQAVAIGGGAEVAQQYLRAGLVDELELHVAPLLLGGGTRLFEGHLGDLPQPLERTRVLVSESTGATHLTYRLRS
jgi:dihydrofolate reductase